MAIEGVDFYDAETRVGAYRLGSYEKTDVLSAQEKNLLDRTIAVSGSSLAQTEHSRGSSKMVELTSIPTIASSVAQVARTTGVTKKAGNFYAQVNQLVAEIMQLMSKLSDRDRLRSESTKKEFEALNTDVSKIIKNTALKNGNAGFISFCASLGTIILGGSPEVGSALGQVVSHFNTLSSADDNAKQAKGTNRLNLLQTELTGMMQKSGDNSAWKNELIQALSEIKQLLQAAARAH